MILNQEMPLILIVLPGHCRYCGAMCMAGMQHIDYGIRPCPVCSEMVDFCDMHHAEACGLIKP